MKPQPQLHRISHVLPNRFASLIHRQSDALTSHSFVSSSLTKTSRASPGRLGRNVLVVPPARARMDNPIPRNALKIGY
ncbi:hypothetical protein [Haladaptatus sp. CMAA 1911]|uniref:hypothetical protein n=1 Tax=unclassified Haladaptatus TaxID=2622732 RepID=UPI003754B7EE